MLNNDLTNRAYNLMPGGVNSPVRAFGAVGGDPIFIQKAAGSKLYSYCGKDCGNEYIDYMMSWGPMILGHAHPEVVEAVQKAAENGLSFGACHEGEIELAEIITNAIDYVDKIRLVNSGTEATMSAVRLARAATGRNKIIKFKGCYHGHADSFLISAGSGALTHGAPSSPGVTPATAADTLLADYNDLLSVENLFLANKDEIACIIVEPIAGNMGIVNPIGDFLIGLRVLCDQHNALLIFDEVITGFRMGFGSASEMFGVKPDLITLGKIIGGGMPLGAYGGRDDLMSLISPEGNVYQAGTLSGNPIACAAGITTLKVLKRDDPYPDLDQKCAEFTKAIAEVIGESNISKWAINRAGSAFTLFFGINNARQFKEIKEVDTNLFSQYFNAMLKEGIYLPPSQYEANFISTAHSDEDIACTLEAIEKVMLGI